MFRNKTNHRLYLLNNGGTILFITLREKLSFSLPKQRKFRNFLSSQCKFTGN
jgi:hypothetical protein